MILYWASNHRCYRYEHLSPVLLFMLSAQVRVKIINVDFIWHAKIYIYIYKNIILLVNEYYTKTHIK